MSDLLVDDDVDINVFNELYPDLDSGHSSRYYDMIL